jgi:hypothetical protein
VLLKNLDNIILLKTLVLAFASKKAHVCVLVLNWSVFRAQTTRFCNAYMLTMAHSLLAQEVARNKGWISYTITLADPD